MSKPKLIINFEDFLMDKFAQDEPCVLDDQMPDAFDEWICDSDPQDLIDLANKYCKKMLAKQRFRIENAIDSVLGSMEGGINEQND